MTATVLMTQERPPLDARQTGESGRASPPLVVDLDGTLVKTDLLVESLLALIKQDLRYLFLVPWWLFRGLAYLKRQVSQRVSLDVSVLPYNPEFLEYLKTERARGRRLILATVANERLA